ncbi:hypothetical protein HDU67_005165, partial [Dinochytrium kinnereticum]
MGTVCCPTTGVCDLADVCPPYAPAPPPPAPPAQTQPTIPRPPAPSSSGAMAEPTYIPSPVPSPSPKPPVASPIGSNPYNPYNATCLETDVNKLYCTNSTHYLVCIGS